MVLPSACTLIANDPFVVLSAASDAVGRASVAAAIANDPSLLGIELVSQWLAVDPQGSLFGFLTASDALRIVIGH